jgi:hypothetical protein
MCKWMGIAAMLWLFLGFTQDPEKLWLTRTAEIQFSSDAPLELIEAKSVNVTGIIRPSDGSFAFSVLNESFDGFNSPLQQEHFYENYMETERFSRSSFSGEIIEQIDFSKPGVHNVRCKGKLDVHGIAQTRIIEAELEITDERIYLSSSFTVLLEDHNIRIPKIVNQKISEEINISISAEMELKEP